MSKKCREILGRIRKMGSAVNRDGMKRFGINVEDAYGVNVYDLRKIAKEIGTDHGLALDLWDTGVHEARLLAGFIADPRQATEDLLESWVSGFDSWDVCDQVCSNLFDQTEFAYDKAVEWSERKEEFVKRAGFVMMAALSVHDKKAKDSDFVKFFPIIKREATDERNFVKKAVNWALRQIGKRNLALNNKAIQVGEQIRKMDSKAARWIAGDALRELTSDKMQNRLQKKQGR